MSEHVNAEAMTHAGWEDLCRILQQERDEAREVACSLLGYLWELWEARGEPSAKELNLREEGHEWLKRP